MGEHVRLDDGDRQVVTILRAEFAEKQTRSIRYQLGIAKLPRAKELTDFTVVDSPVNQPLIDDLATGLKADRSELERRSSPSPTPRPRVGRRARA